MGAGAVNPSLKLPPVTPAPRVTVWISLSGTFSTPSGEERATPVAVAVAGFVISIALVLSLLTTVPGGMPGAEIVWPRTKAFSVTATESIVVEPAVVEPTPATPPLTTPAPNMRRNSPLGPNFWIRSLVSST